MIEDLNDVTKTTNELSIGYVVNKETAVVDGEDVDYWVVERTATKDFEIGGLAASDAEELKGWMEIVYLRPRSHISYQEGAIPTAISTNERLTKIYESNRGGGFCALKVDVLEKDKRVSSTEPANPATVFNDYSSRTYNGQGDSGTGGLQLLSAACSLDDRYLVATFNLDMTERAQFIGLYRSVVDVYWTFGTRCQFTSHYVSPTNNKVVYFYPLSAALHATEKWIMGKAEFGSIRIKFPNIIQITATYYTVNFNTDGGSEVPSQSVRAGTRAERPYPDPTKEGLYFVGWYSDDLHQNPFDFSTAITGDTYLYARFSETSVVFVTYNTNGGSEIPRQEYQYGDPLMILGSTKQDAQSVKWYYDSAFTRQAFDGDAVVANTVLHAKWFRQVRFFDGEGWTHEAEDRFIHEGTAVGTLPVAMEVVGKTFSHWQAESGGLVTEEFTPLESYTAVYAIYTTTE